LFGSGHVLFIASYLKGIKKLSAAERAKISIPEETKEVIVGTLLGVASQPT
jgi:hypothetical protein